MNHKYLGAAAVLSLIFAVGLLWALNTPSDPVWAQAQTDDAGATTCASNVSKADVLDVCRSGALAAQGTDLSRSVVGAPSSGVVANGDFESGRDGSWAEFSTHGWDIVTDTTALPLTPHSGNWAAWLGGDHLDVSYISQTVPIPTDAPVLSFWYWIGSDDACGYDQGWVQVDDTTVLTLSLCYDNNTSSWTRQLVDLGAYAAMTVSLQIRVETDDSLYSNLYIDDVTLEGGSYTYLPLVYKDYWPPYFDDFSDPDSGWYVADEPWARMGYVGGEYQIRLADPWGWAWGTPDLVLPSNYAIEADARHASSNLGVYGLRFGLRYSGGNPIEFYQFLVDPDAREYLLEKYDNGSWDVLIDWTYSSNINQGAGTNHLGVSRVGSSISVYVNDVQVGTASDGDFSGPGRDAGLIFLLLEGDSAPADARFDNFSAYTP